MRMGEERTRKAKDVARERWDGPPRPVKVLTVAFYEDEDGNPTTPMINRTFRVAPVAKTCAFVDNQCVEQRFDLEPGELDWTSGMICVKEEELDEEGELIQVHVLSHEIQRMPYRKGTDFAGGKIVWTQSFANSPNAIRARFNPTKRGKKRAAILDHWQKQADSPDAVWLDGKCPSQEEYEEAQALYEEKKAARTRGRNTNAPQQNEKTPAGITEGEDFENFDT